MIGLVIVAVLLGVGLPLFRDFVLAQKLRSATADLRIALTTARSESVKRNFGMTLEALDGGWSEGWQIMDPNQPDLAILTHVQPGDVSLAVDPDADINFTPTGRATAAVSFEIDVGTADEAALGCLQLQLDGRALSTKGACP
jgi:type IV fimbrial biogenesis protein FimT